MGVIFIAGAYGVGKSTLCNALSKELRIPAFSASDLISAVNGENYGANKVVSNKEKNQDILSKEVYKLLKQYERIILAGHFCIFDKKNNVLKLPESVFRELNIEMIILLEAPCEIILKNLQSRDNKKYTFEQIEQLLIEERAVASNITNNNNYKFIIYEMRFDKTDIECVMNILQHGVKK